MISAPVAPIAPPSVGVATPRKIVPSTRKISASGGISTNTTRSAIFDSSPNLKTRFSDRGEERDGGADARRDHEHLVEWRSRCIRSFAYATAEIAATIDEHEQRRGCRAEPSGSRIVRASGGSAGAHSGLTIVVPSTYSA